MKLFTCSPNANGNKEKQHELPFSLAGSSPNPYRQAKPARRHRLIPFLIGVVCLMGSFRAYGQSITITLKNAPLEKALTAIEKQSGYDFWYDQALLKKAAPVDLSLKKASLKEALDQCFKNQPLSYTISDKTIVVKEKTGTVKAPVPTRKITGKVSDELGLALPGVTVMEKGGTNAAMTDGSGSFAIEVHGDEAFLLFSILGYQTREVSIGKERNLNVVLRELRAQLDQVQIIGYGTTTQRLGTGSVGTIKAKDIENQPVSNPLAALQGRIPGVVIEQNSGVAGSGFKLQIRGQSALDLSLSKNDPLIIIDGVPFEPGNNPSSSYFSAATASNGTGGLSPLNTINPMDIESIDVLKDADATSIYGSRGANGVIIISTKKGKPGATNFGVNVYSGWSGVGRTVHLLNTEQYIAVRKEAFRNDGLVPSANQADPGYAPDIMLWDTTRYTDFTEMLIGNTAYANNIQATLSGGSANTQFLISGNFRRETTVFSKEFADNVASLRFNLNHTSSDGRFKAVLSGSYAADKNKLPTTDLSRYIFLPPNMLLKDASGKPLWEDKGVAYSTLGSGIFSYNPLALLLQEYSNLNENLSGNLQLSYKLLPFLELKLNTGYNVFSSDETRKQASASLSPYATGSGLLPSAAFRTATNRNWIVEPQLEYRFQRNGHSLSAFAGSTWQDKTQKENAAQGANYSSDLLLGSIAAAGTVFASNDYTRYRYAALFGRISYNYKDKYLINLNGRRDGSSRFGPNEQWANFGSVGLAWLFLQEGFIKKNLTWLSYGKLRASYGTTGNDQIGDYKFLNLWSNGNNKYDGLSVLNPRNLYNPDYAWEINRKLEVALEMGLFDDDLLLNIAYYRNRSNNQLINYVLPTQTGFGVVVKNFPGLVQNSGLEFTVNTRNLHKGKLTWTTAFNISIPENKLVAFPGLEQSGYYRTSYLLGKSLNIQRGIHFLGIDPQTGQYTFEDLNGDGYISNPEDYQFFADLDPRFYGGIQNNFSFKNIELGFFFQFTKQKGPSYIKQIGGYIPGMINNIPEDLLDRWQQPGDAKAFQRFTASSVSAVATAQRNYAGSDASFVDASFIKLKNVSLSYRLAGQWLKACGVSNARIYAEAQNLFTITRYEGGDPEVKNIEALPPLRTVVLGFQLNF